VTKPTSSWLEPLLTHELHRVPAPAELWERVRLPANPRIIQPLRRTVSVWFACAWAAVLLLASAVGLHAYLKSEIPQGAARSSDSARFQAWVRASTGLDLHTACHLCHAGDELQAVVPRGVY
jgi:hypothetical protein